MATLPENERQQVHRGLMRYWSSLFEEMPYLSPELKAAVDATDDWIEANQAAYNAALPEPFRSNAALSQKTILLSAVASMRVSPEFARRLFGTLFN